jgi:hypothetical protein
MVFSMSDNKKPAPTSPNAGQLICPARTPGPLGVNDQGDPSVLTRLGATPGPTGINDYGQQVCWAPRPGIPPATRQDTGPPSTGDMLSEEPVSGAVAVGTGAASVVRIPVPGSGGLHVELSPRGYVPKAGSTSTLFIQDITGKRHLRLDFGYNKTTGKIDYHWNQKGTYETFKIPDHSPAGPGGEPLYKGAKYFRYGGRVLLVAGAIVDVYSIVVAKKRLRQAAKVVSGWAGAWAGCKIVGAGGAAIGTAVEPGGGTAVGGIGGCVVGSIGGYIGASWAAGELYDWVEETFFEPLPEVQAPPGFQLQ